jgi:hypothetical protein
MEISNQYLNWQRKSRYVMDNVKNCMRDCSGCARAVGAGRRVRSSREWVGPYGRWARSWMELKPMALTASSIICE